MIAADPGYAFNDDEPRFPSVITPERRWHIVRHAKDIREWLAKLHEDSLVGEPDRAEHVGDLG